MKKSALLAGFLLPIILLTGCTSTSTEYGKSTKTNEEHGVVVPDVPQEIAGEEIIQGLPEGFPDIPVMDDSYIKGTYHTEDVVEGVKMWNISLLSDFEPEPIISMMESAGYKLTNNDDHATLHFSDSTYQVVMVGSNYSGSEVVTYHISEHPPA